MTEPETTTFEPGENFRLGQLHRYAGPGRSTTVWYGVEPLPRQRPQTSVSWTPVPAHGAGVASDRPAPCDHTSGASASTCSAVQRVPTQGG